MLKKLLAAVTTKAQLIDRVQELTARVDALQSVVEDVDTEWTDWYEKFRTLHARIAKRVRDAERGNGGEVATVDSPRPQGESYSERLAAARARYTSRGNL